MRNLGLGMRNVELSMFDFNVESGMMDFGIGMWHVECELCYLKCGICDE